MNRHLTGILLLCVSNFCTENPVYAQFTQFATRAGVSEFHLSEVVSEIQNGSSTQTAIINQFSNTPNLGIDVVRVTANKFVLTGGGNFGSTNLIPSYAAQTGELKTISKINNQTIKDSVKFDGTSEYWRLRGGIGWSSSSDLDDPFMLIVSVLGEGGSGSSIYFNQIFAAYNPTTGLLDQSKIEATKTSWAGAYLNIHLNFNIGKNANGDSIFFGILFSAPRIWNNGVMQKVFTPSTFFQLSIPLGH
jgi:hypothetical protein